MIGNGKETAVAKASKKTTRRVSRATIFFLALGMGMLAPLGRASRTSDQQEASQHQASERQSTTQTPDQPGTTQPSEPQVTVQASPAERGPQDTSHSQLSAKERENLQHQTEKGTSKDRILWTLPNFLTVENADNIPPLTAGQKFKVVGRSLIDPSEFVLIGFVAGLGQASDSNPSYGQGAQGYAKRYGTSYADNAVENFMSSAVLPSMLHQDPRYYQLGRGGFWRRVGHAVGRVVITRSDAGQRQFNYSEVFGAGMAAAISTYSYHPESERRLGNVAGVWTTQIGWDVATYLIKEFWPDLRKKHRKDS